MGASARADRAGVPSGLSRRGVSGKAAHPSRYSCAYCGLRGDTIADIWASNCGHCGAPDSFLVAELGGHHG